MAFAGEPVNVRIGAGAGAIGAFALTGSLRTVLYQVTPADPITFAGVGLLLIASALAACSIPARRAARVDAWKALRCE